jgi:adenylate cyclase
MAQEASLAILFADVCGSTKLYETLGDATARKMIGRCIDLMTAATTAHGGRLIKVIGDEVMCTFPRADDCAGAALDLQERVSSAAVTGLALANMAIHVGFHYGPVVHEDNDVFGDAVNVAARMVNLAKPDQVVTTGPTVESLSEKWRKTARQIDRTAVKGKSEELDVYELIWQEEEVTRIAGKSWIPEKLAVQEHLTLDYGAHEIEVSDKHPMVTVGRGEQNELVIHEDVVSRLHARIEYRNHRFTLTDQSTNGSYMIDASGTPRLVRHDSLTLSGAGAICFGRKPVPNDTGLLRFRIGAA